MSNSPNNKKGGPVFGYLAIMFAAAFLMLLLAYFIQQRNNNVAMAGLRDSISSFESMDELLDDNRALRAEVAALEDEITSLQTEHSALEKSYSALKDETDALNESYESEILSWQAFYLMETYYLNGQYEACAKQLAFIRNSDHLNIPNETLDHYNTLERCNEIDTALQAMGYETNGTDSES